MQYTIQTRYKNGTIEFYYTFGNEAVAFLQHLSSKTNLKDEVGALSFAIALAKRTIRVIVPLGTSERQFNEKMHKFFEIESNMQFVKNGNNETTNFADIFGDIFGRKQ